MYGLTPDVISKLKKIFSKFEKINKVVLYGSRAKGNYRKGSDIDLTLFGDNLDLKTVYAIEDEIEELYLPYKFDVSIYKQIENHDLREHIERVGKIFYSTPP